MEPWFISLSLHYPHANDFGTVVSENFFFVCVYVDVGFSMLMVKKFREVGKSNTYQSMRRLNNNYYNANGKQPQNKFSTYIFVVNSMRMDTISPSDIVSMPSKMA